MQIGNIDGGKTFDWGKTSSDYARFRDIYPEKFYNRLLELGAGSKGQDILDLGTGTGVLPRNMYRYGAHWTGTDISENQIEQAKILAAENNMDIDFSVCCAEDADFQDNSFDVITACQCIWYFKHNITAPKFAKMLRPGGKFFILYMGWLPYEDATAKRSEDIILKYNPDWTGFGDTRKHVWVPDEYIEYFDIKLQEEFDVRIPFTRESWHGRIRACRGVSASMKEETLAQWDEEHRRMLELNNDEKFEILHYVSIAELQKKP